MSPAEPPLGQSAVPEWLAAVIPETPEALSGIVSGATLFAIPRPRGTAARCNARGTTGRGGYAAPGRLFSKAMVIL